MAQSRPMLKNLPSLQFFLEFFLPFVPFSSPPFLLFLKLYTSFLSHSLSLCILSFFLRHPTPFSSTLSSLYFFFFFLLVTISIIDHGTFLFRERGQVWRVIDYAVANQIAVLCLSPASSRITRPNQEQQHFRPLALAGRWVNTAGKIALSCRKTNSAWLWRDYLMFKKKKGINEQWEV